MLADLHAVDVDEVGLENFARRDGYIERQVRRWSTQWEKSRTRELPAVDEVAERLAARMPVQHGVAIVHGDYRFGNCLTDTARGADRGGPRLGAVHPRRPAGRPRVSRGVLDRPR